MLGLKLNKKPRLVRGFLLTEKKMKVTRDQLSNLLISSKITEHLYENVELKRSWSREHGEKASMLCNGNPISENFMIIGIEDDGALAGRLAKKELRNNITTAELRFRPIPCVNRN